MPADILCNINHGSGPSFKVEEWETANLFVAETQRARSVALLEGGLLALASFLLILAITNKQLLYLSLSAWLIGNLRVGFMALGWDAQWLGYTIPTDWLPLIRNVSLAAHFLISYVLLTQLLRSTLGPLPLARVRQALLISGCTLFVASFFLSAALFIPLIWGLAVAGLSTCVAIITLRLQSRHAVNIRFWHLVLVSMAICLLISCTLLSITGRTHFVDILNGVVALLLSNLLIAMAIGDRIYSDYQANLRARQKGSANDTLIPIGLFSLNSAEEIEDANTAFKQLIGLSAQDLLPRHWTEFFPEVDWENVIKQSLNGNETEITRLTIKNSPHVLPLYFGLRAVRIDDHIEGSLRDINAKAEAMRELQVMADNDPVTNVLNIRGVEKALAASLERSKNGENCVLAYLSLNHVKQVSSTYGRAASDALLREVSERIGTLLQPDQDMGRLGRDEFVILFNNCSAEEAKIAAEEIIAILNEQTIQIGNRSVNLQSSIGLVEVSANAKADDLLSAANRACRDAQREPTPIVVYKRDSQELHDHAEELRLFKELEDGSSSAFYLEMQPIMALNQPLESLNFEILLRVCDSKGKLIPTGKIIAAAEESGTISIIDKWVVSATLEWLDKHYSQLQRTQFININLSGVSLNEDTFIDDLFAILARYEHLNHCLCIEITEGVALHDLERTREFMKRLQKMGARIALDDFGAGYTSFSYLRELPADAIKIDGALIKDMLRRDTNIAIVRTIVELARNLGMNSIAEWVEDPETLAILHEIKVDYVQGFVVSAARSPAEILKATDIRDLVAEPKVIHFINQHSLTTGPTTPPA